MTSDAYTRPERSAEMGQARRVMKRMRAARAKHGNCVICIHREQTFGIFHCRNNEARRFGACDLDQRQPRFAFDDQTLSEFQDAA